ncbi:hypothetical protein N658DRAFT_487033 [Parathielavia hyrcaniae]|uniref:Uncharacterized protein n=1 Tax=Parathielavia hyrcaniae TaxID=113614 RepID=A0AAN6T108_9PEZI|nr:hypothetical protein N658DRAFT_487033 [Parathielavia hyrcaniae]
MVNLRASSMLRVPGRYQEDLGPSRADRPIFVHLDVPFNAALVPHCAHPSLPLNHPELGPSEAELARLGALAMGQTAETEIESVGGESDSGESLDGEEDEDNASDDPEAPARGRANGPAAPGGQGGQPAARPAHVAKVARGGRSAARSDGGGEGNLFAETASDKSGETAPSINHGARPNWVNLSDGIKYAILYDMTRTAPLSRAVQHLGLEYDEVTSLLALLEAEREKKKRYEVLMRRVGGAEIPSGDELLALAAVTEGISAREVRRGRGFLRFLGIADIHDIEIDEGVEDLVNDVSVSSAGEGQSSRTRRQLLSMTGPELILRLDPPPDSINPRRLKGGAPSARAENLDPVQASQSNGLHQANYEVKSQDASSSAILDTLVRPSWGSLRPVSNIPVTDLTVFTARPVDHVDFSEFVHLSDDDKTDRGTGPPDDTVQPAAAPENLDLEDPLPMPGFDELPSLVCFPYPTGQASDPYPQAPHNGYVSPWDVHTGPVFARGALDSPEVAVGQQQSGREVAASAAESAPSRLVAEYGFACSAPVGEDGEMRGVPNQTPLQQLSESVNAGPGTLEAHGNIPAAQLMPSQVDDSALALHGFFNTPAPVVRPLDPETAMSIAAVLARYNCRVSFSGENQADSKPGRPSLGPVDRRQFLEEEFPEESISDEDILPRYVPRPREPDDKEWKPSRTGTRKPRRRTSGATSSSARKRTRAESPSAEQAPKRGRPPLAAPRRQSAADNTSPTPVKRANPTSASTRPILPKSMASNQPRGQAAVPQQSTSDTAQNSSSVPTDDMGTEMSPETVSRPDDAFTDARFAVYPSSSLASALQEPKTSRMTTQREHPEPELDEEVKPAKKPIRIRIKVNPSRKLDESELAIEPKKRGRKLKPDDDELSIEPKKRGSKLKADDDELSIVPKKRGRKPKADDDGNPAKPKRRRRGAAEPDENAKPKKKRVVNRRPPQYDENGNRIRLVRRERNLNEHGRPIKYSTVPGASFHVRPDVLMRSTEGEEMTRGEFDKAFTIPERKYLAGGAVSGGRYQIIATGVIWSFTKEFRNQSEQENDDGKSGNEDGSQALSDSQRSVRAESSQDGGVLSEYGAGTSQGSVEPSADTSDDDDSSSSDEASSSADSDDAQAPATGPQPAFSTPARNPTRLVLGLTPPNRSGQTTLAGFARPSPPTRTPTRITLRSSAVVAPRAPAADPRVALAADPRVAARVAELNERCRLYNVRTRDRFASDQEFLDYAEGMLPLLYPVTSGRPKAPATKPYHDGSGDGGGRGPRFGGHESFI